MDSVLSGLPFVFAYPDDVLIASKGRKEHLEHLKILLGRLSDHGLVVNAEKCKFGASVIDFLGHQVSVGGIAPLPGKVEGIRKFPKPRTMLELQRFIGMVNYYHRFLPNAAKVMVPLIKVLDVNPKAKTIPWNEQAVAALQETKELQAQAALLAHPIEGASLAIETDASDLAVGAVLQQLTKKNAWQPLRFFSRKVKDMETRYSAFDKELLAMYISNHKTLHTPCRRAPLHHLHGPQAPDVQHIEGRHTSIGEAAKTSLIHRRTHFRYPTHFGSEECRRRCTVSTAAHQQCLAGNRLREDGCRSNHGPTVRF